MTDTVSARVALDLNELAKTLVENLDGDRLAGFIYNLVGLRSDKLWEAELIAELSEPYEVPAPVAPATEDPAPREPRVWQAGDPEPEGVDLVHDIDATDQDELVYARRMPDGLWRWLFTIDEEVGKRGDMPWQNLFGVVATGRLAEVLSSALPTPGGAK